MKYICVSLSTEHNKPMRPYVQIKYILTTTVYKRKKIYAYIDSAEMRMNTQ